VLVDRFCSLATDPVDRLRGERMMGASLHYLGDQANARQILEGVLSRTFAQLRQSRAVPFQYGRPNARLILSRILWLQGFPDQGLRLAERNVDDARAIDLAVGVCYALEIASLVSIWSSDLAATERHVTALLDYSARHALAAWHRPARCYDGIRLIQRGMWVRDSSCSVLRSTSFGGRASSRITRSCSATSRKAWPRRGQIAQAFATIDEALGKSERDEERWWIAELLRIKAELILLAADADAALTAEAHLQDALHGHAGKARCPWSCDAPPTSPAVWHHQGTGRAGARPHWPRSYARFNRGGTPPTADLEAASNLESAALSRHRIAYKRPRQASLSLRTADPTFETETRREDNRPLEICDRHKSRVGPERQQAAISSAQAGNGRRYRVNPRQIFSTTGLVTYGSPSGDHALRYCALSLRPNARAGTATPNPIDSSHIFAMEQLE
jgi:hypothetical protein